ncbi:cell envelope integrity EipB family protein [Methylosinus sp. Sm6]|uniref:cell envelope integrity EipB family protein n=1 Tax=Methylosinus sp. Sm6 TaxID=2866948 RepID=UPI001C99B80F|nr:cell envelope integrity EipB family protein [Methylosinus sp. Sm6]MBY6239718.1 cell envelope integrity EipB family protein [Methylosinus sp. Sm6]
MAPARILGAIIGCASIIAPGAALADAAAAAVVALPQLAPHRAVYDLSLGQASGGKAPSSARGRIAFDFSGSACEGYVQNFRQITELQPSEGPARLSDMRSNTFETGDGKDFRFRIETRLDNVPSENIDGKAKKSGGASMSVDLAQPKHSSLALDGGALFPTEHLRHILAAAGGGETILEAKVYDGSGDGEKIFDTLTVLGKATSAAAGEKAAQIKPLEGLRRWPVSISYFEPGKRDEQPVYVLSFDLYENGISRALKLDYGDFVLTGEMTELALLPASSSCNKM